MSRNHKGALSVETDITAGRSLSVGNGTSVGSQRVSQVAHGFSVGSVLRSSGTDSEYALAQADSAVNARYHGIVTRVVDANTFELSGPGAWITSGVSAQAAGSIMYLDAATAGSLTLTAPTIAMPVLQIAANGASAQILSPALVAATGYPSSISRTTSAVLNGTNHGAIVEVTASAGDLTMTIEADTESSAFEAASYRVRNLSAVGNLQVHVVADASLTGGIKTSGESPSLRPGETGTIHYSADGLTAYLSIENRVYVRDFLTDFLFNSTAYVSAVASDGSAIPAPSHIARDGLGWSLADTGAAALTRYYNDLHFIPANGQVIAFRMRFAKALAAQDIQLAYRDGGNVANMLVNLFDGTISLANSVIGNLLEISAASSLLLGDVVEITWELQLTAAPTGTPTLDIAPVCNLTGNGTVVSSATGSATMYSFEVGDPSMLKDVAQYGEWAGATDYVAGQIVTHGVRTLRRLTAGTSSASFDSVEAALWELTAQSAPSAWAATTTYMEKEQVFLGGVLYSSLSTRTTTAQFDAAEKVFWSSLGGVGHVGAWAAGTYYNADVLARRASDDAVLRRVTAGYSEATFDVAEAGAWTVVSQDTLPAYAQATTYVPKERILVDGSIYYRTSAGTSPADAFSSDAANWTLLYAEKALKTIDYMLPADTSPSAGTGAVTRVASPYGDGDMRTLSDTDATTQTTYDLPLGSIDFAATDTYQVRLWVAASALPNQVLSLKYSDDGGNTAEEFIELGTGGIATVAGGGDTGNVSATAATATFNRGDTDLARVDITLAWVGASGANPKIVISPAYNLDGTSVADATATGSVSIWNVAVGAVAEFASASGMTAQGIITADPAAALPNSIYLGDASGAAFDFTLPAATGSGARVEIVGVSVDTNAITIKVQVGETLLTSLNGSYTLDTNQQRIALMDSAVGVWNIAVMAEGSAQSLHRVSYTYLGKTQADAANLVLAALPVTSSFDLATSTGLIAASTSTHDPNSMIVGETLVIRQGGTYKISANAAMGQAPNAFRWGVHVDGVTVYTEQSGVLSDGADGAKHTLASLDLGTLSAGQVVEFLAHGHDAFGEMDSWHILLEQVPTKEVVLAGMATLAPLHYASMTTASIGAFTGVDDPIIFGTTLDDTGGMVTSTTVVTIQQDGKYEVSFDVSGDMDETISNDRYIYVVKNDTAPVDDTAAIAAAILEDHAYVNSQTPGVAQWGAQGIFDLVAGDTLICYFGAASGNDRVKAAHLIVKQLPVSTVAAGEPLPGRLLGVQKFTTPGANTYTPTVGTTNARVIILGGGGAGGGAVSSSNQAGGAGGGAGALQELYTPITATTYALTVGAGGVAASGGSGGAGGSSDFTGDGPSTYTCSGGLGGSTVATPSAGPDRALGGDGGSATTGPDTITSTGGQGGFPYYDEGATSVGYAGAGGSVGQYGSGGKALAINGAGSIAGQVAGGAGAGGGGALQNDSTARPGGAGASGIVIIFEYS